MTYIQVVVGGRQLPSDVIATHGGAAIFQGEVTDWTPPPALPDNPNPVTLDNLPTPVKEALAKALANAMEKATGFTVRVEV